MSVVIFFLYFEGKDGGHDSDYKCHLTVLKTNFWWHQDLLLGCLSSMPICAAECISDEINSFFVETKAKILAERDKTSAEAAFKALDVDGDGRYCTWFPK